MPFDLQPKILRFLQEGQFERLGSEKSKQVDVRIFSDKYNKSIIDISKHDMEKLKSYHWPGNIRELENVLERAVISCTNSKLHIDLGPETSRSANKEKDTDLKSLEEVERHHIMQVLQACEWRISGNGGAAEILGLHPNTLRSRMKKLNINKSFR